MKRIFQAIWLSLAIALGMALTPSVATAQSTWDKIEKSGTLRVGVIPNRPPYFWQENNQWVGFSTTMGVDLAKALSTAMKKDIKIDWVITSWTTVILDIQADKLDAFFGLSFSEDRKKAINLAGPLYELPSVAINAHNFNPGHNWADFNKPEVKVSVVMGTTDEQAARKFLPNSNIRAMKGMAEAVLDIQSGNAQTMITTVLTGLGALKENKSLGSMTVLMPANTMPSYGGTRRDGDDRFARFFQKWAEDYRADGRAQKSIFGAMEKFGLDVGQIPKEVKF